MKRLLRFSGEAAWTAAILSGFAAAVEAAAGRGQKAFHASLAGGRTPEPAYRALAAAPSLASLSGKIRIHLWVGDERDVPADSPFRNGRMISEVFGEGAAAARWSSPPEIHLWPEGSREEACALYAREMIASMGEPPVFDLAILGMGADGHTAGIFSPVAKTREPMALPTTAPAEPKMRMTMSAGLLKASRTTMVLVGGTEKLAALEAVLKGASFPLSLALGARTAFYYLE